MNGTFKDECFVSFTEEAELFSALDDATDAHST